jgi:predicted acyl esterase
MQESYRCIIVIPLEDCSAFLLSDANAAQEVRSPVPKVSQEEEPLTHSSAPTDETEQLTDLFRAAVRVSNDNVGAHFHVDLCRMGHSVTLKMAGVYNPLEFR